MNIGEKLKHGRSERKMTQEEVANILNVSRSTVSSWEVNRTYPDLEILVSLSDLYELSLDSMLREDEQLVQTLTQDIKTSQKRKNWLIVLVMLYIPVLLFLSYLLWYRDSLISSNPVEMFSLGGVDAITLLMIGSLVFGLIAWALPILNILFFQKTKDPNIAIMLSLSACATAISFQVIYNNSMINKNDIAGLMDTSGVLTVVSIILLLGTLILNGVSYFKISRITVV